MQQYISLYNDCRDLIFSHSAELMNRRRDEAFGNFCRQGLPSRKVERYKYTDIDGMLEPDYGLNLSRLTIPANPTAAFRCDVPNLSTSLYFVVNDALAADYLPKVALPEGVEVCTLSRFAAAHPDVAERYYGQLADTADDSLTALNTALAQEALVVYVAKGARVGKTIQVINILRSDVELMVNRRVLVILDDDSEATLLFCDHAADYRRFLVTQVVEVFVGRNSNLHLYCLEETHDLTSRISNLYIRQEADSHVSHSQLTLNCGTTRNRTDLMFNGEGADCSLSGAVVADGHQHVDNNTLIDHRTPHCQSEELYKYVVDDEATCAFAGRVLVRHGAQQTVSNERNQNLLATPTARMYTQPMLEIYADDVKCAHGSTVGQINDAALFYMRQRGIPEPEARTLLQEAFIGEVVDAIELTPLRDRLRHLVEKRFRGGFRSGGCAECSFN